MGEVSTWSGTDDSNTDLFPENMPFGDVNDGGRAIQGAVARWFNDWNGSVTSSGSSNAYAITSNRTIGSLANNTLMWFRASFTNTGACTLNLNGLGAKDIIRATGSALTAGDITSGQIVGVYYNSTLDDWVLITPAVQGAASESASGLIELATAAEVEALDSERAVRASTMHRHPGHPKAWVKFAGSSTINADYGVSSIDDNNTGDFTFNFDTAFSTADYAPSAISQRPATNSAGFVSIKQGVAPTAAALNLMFVDNNVSAHDPSYAAVTVLGDH
jgi:hypothetical protein